ncbi:MAG: TonB-dependent hemoglobin/transferrin/lactoferrin family receptor [Pseudomonadota bacterium]
MSPLISRAFLAGSTFLFSFHLALAQEVSENSEESVDNSGASVLDLITIYGDRQGRKPLDLPANITVIDGEEIDDKAITDIKELVRDEPGVEVVRQTTGTDPFNSYGGVTIRGVGGNRVQLLIDGARVPERITDGHRDYFDFNFTKQADIVRGPGSVLWGADALGGIVALETVDPEDILNGRISGGEAETSYSSLDNEWNNAFTYAHQLSPTLSVLGGVSYNKANEAKLSNARADGGPFGSCPRDLAAGATPCNELDPTDTRRFRGLGKVVFEPTDDHRFELSADFMNRETNVDYNQTLGARLSTFSGNPNGIIGLGYDRTLEVETQRYIFQHDWHVGGQFIDDIKWSVRHTPNSSIRTGTDHRMEANGDEVIDHDFLSLDEDFTEFDVQFTSRFDLGASKHTVTWGFDGDRTTTDYQRIDTVRNLTTNTTTVTRGGGFNFANADTTRADFFIQDQIELFDGMLEITPGVRFTHYNLDPRFDGDYQVVLGSEPVEVTANEVLYSISADLDLTDELSLYSAFNQGFKMPTAQQLYTSLPGRFFNLIPNPNLRPETVDNYELGLRKETDRGFFSVTGFYADYTDFIQSFVFQPNGIDITYENLSSVMLYGIEASAGYDFTDNLRGDISFAWQQGTQKTNAAAAEQEFLAPPVKAVLGLTYEIPEHDLTLEAVGTLVRKTTRLPTPTNFKPHGYALLDLYAKWQPTENSEFRFGVKNVFDKSYYEFGAANTAPPRNDATRAVNPIELQKGAGRVFEVGYKVTF